MLTNDEAERLMMPFFPDNPHLAVRALDNAMYTQDDISMPEWIWEAVVQHYFTQLLIKNMSLRQKHMLDQLSAEDPFKIQTIPLPVLEKPYVN